MKIGVTIMPRNEVLDSQGRAVEATLKAHDLTADAVRIGKYVELEVDAPDEASAVGKARQIAEFVLYNPLIETYRLAVIKS